MPYLESDYRAPFLFRNGHWSTIYYGAIKKTRPPAYQREKWFLKEDDFLLVDFLEKDSNKALILCHGLEGNSRRNYNNLVAQYFLDRGYSIFAWNNRSCGGEMNLTPQLYHHASIDDLDQVVQRVIGLGYKTLYLMGFSLGGVQLLNYLGNRRIAQQVKAVVAVSTPISLQSSFEQIAKGFSRLYTFRFIQLLKQKVLKKAEMFPKLLNKEDVKSIRTFFDLARVFIAPIHGFSSLTEYLIQASPQRTLNEIKTPVLILNAQNDPMLGVADYPREAAQRNPFLFLETPPQGGHCAFPLMGRNYSYVAERSQWFFQNQSALLREPLAKKISL